MAVGIELEEVAKGLDGDGGAGSVMTERTGALFPGM
jgi:hypothetical protein